jgi:hypothetical protein
MAQAIESVDPSMPTESLAAYAGPDAIVPTIAAANAMEAGVPTLALTTLDLSEPMEV